MEALFATRCSETFPRLRLGDWRYSGLILGAGAAVFFLHHYAQAIPMPVIQVLDAAGLALFAIAGTQKAMMHGMNWLVAVLLGTITGVGGGTIRDVLLAQIPTVLRFEVYATAALAGSVCRVVARRLRMSTNLAAAIGGATCFLLRVISVWRHWNLPRALH